MDQILQTLRDERFEIAEALIIGDSSPIETPEEYETRMNNLRASLVELDRDIAALIQGAILLP